MSPLISGCCGRNTDQSNSGADGTRTETREWEQEIDRRIAANRTQTLNVVVVDSEGHHVPHARVTVEMTDHAFTFGTAVNAGHFVDETSPGDRYRRAIRTLFNEAALERRHKWGPWLDASHRRKAEIATWWLVDQGIDLRGHVAIWQRFGTGALPDSIERVVREDGVDAAPEVRRRSLDHIEDIVGHYAGNFEKWEVVNEQIDRHRLTDVLNPDDSPQRAPALLEWFDTTKRADGDARLLLNENKIITGDAEAHKSAYEELIGFLLDNEAALGGVGVQGHTPNADAARSPHQLLDTFDRFGAFGVPLAVTEFDTYGEGWGEKEQAEYLRQVMKVAFGHPAVSGFSIWGFYDGVHWQNNAPLFREDWSPKPGYDVYTDLVFDQWWTDKQGRTEQSGEYTTRVFLGTHDIAAAIDGRTATATVTLTNPDQPTSVTIRLPDG
jgi:GH35 family endo-1,4-beta-xylanase